MKKSILSAAVTAASTAMLMSSGAMAYDTWDFTGLSDVELHYLRSIAAPGDDSGWGGPAEGNFVAPSDLGCPQGRPCDVIAGTLPIEVQSVMLVNNKTVSSDPIAPGVIDPLAPPTVAECYSVTSSDYDASGNLVSGDIGTLQRLISHVFAPTLNPGAPQPRNSTENTIVIPDLFEFCTNEEGKITSGYFGFFTSIPANPTTWSITSFDNYRPVSFINGSAGLQNQNLPTAAEADAIIAQIEAGTTPATGGYGAANDWVFSAAGYLGYETCDITKECGQFGKSVPVPAFAAAALGLGLLGITYLTGRRRAIK